MLLKSADDKSKRLNLLEDLQLSPLLDFDQKEWLRKELWSFKQGIQGERDSAHYLDSYFKDGENHIVLHDLRFEADGEVAQIDHLILNRGGIVYLLETKNYGGNLIINDQGEFTVHYEGGRQFGIPSPIEQSLRHERVLIKLFERLEIEGRTQKLPEFHHVVMLHPRAIIERPPAKTFDTSNVIKADQFPTWHKRFVDQLGVGSVFKFALNLRNLDTLKEQGKKLLRQHRPANILALPEFMSPQKPVPAKVPTAVITPGTKIFNHRIAPAQPETTRTQATDFVRNSSTVAARPWVCSPCSKGISLGIQKYCLDDAKRFGGLVFCMEHQNHFAPA